MRFTKQDFLDGKVAIQGIKDEGTLESKRFSEFLGVYYGDSYRSAYFYDGKQMVYKLIDLIKDIPVVQFSDMVEDIVYTPEYVKKNKIAIMVKNEEEYEEIAKLFNVYNKPKYSSFSRRNPAFGCNNSGWGAYADMEIYIEAGYKTISASVVLNQAAQEVVLTLGSSQIKITIRNGKITADGKEFSLYKLKNIAATMIASSNAYDVGYPVSFPTVKIGCSRFQLLDLNTIISTAEKQIKSNESD